MAADTDPPSGIDEKTGRDLQDVSTGVGAAIGDLIRTTLGPAGMEKMLADTDGMVLITNDTKTILGELGMNLNLLPSARLLRELAIGQNEEVGDGAATAVVVAGELLRNAESMFDKGVHPTTVTRGYDLAARRAATEITDASIEVDIDDTIRLEQIVRTTIAGSGSVDDEEALALLLVEAAEELASMGDLSWDRLTVKKVPGGTMSNSFLTRGIVFEGSPVHVGMPRFVEPGKVACLNTNLTPPPLDETSAEQGEVVVRDADEFDSLLNFETEALQSKIDAIVESGANAVFSNKSIDERAQQAFAEEGILALRRMATSNMKNVARATGATISDPGVIDSSDLGDAVHVEHEMLGREDVISIKTEKPDHVTLVLRGGTKQTLNEIERAVRTGFGALRTLYDEERRFVPGGGAVEMRASLALRETAVGMGKREELAVRAFADALEMIPHSIAENAGLDPIDAVAELRHRHGSGDETAGIRAFERRVDDVVAPGIVDPVVVKRRAITTAADVVNRIVRIDNVLEAETEEEIK